MINGIKSKYFGITKGIAQGCTLFPTLFLSFVDSMKEIKNVIGLSDLKQGLQDMIDVPRAYSTKCMVL